MEKVTYKLSIELERNPRMIKMAQSLTLDLSRPGMGLKGSFGLYGSDEWWKSIDEGLLKCRKIRGTVTRVYCAGQSEGGKVNSFELKLDDGGKYSESIYVNERGDYKLFKVGSVVEILYVFDELKVADSLSGSRYSDIVLRMSVFNGEVES